MNTTTRLRDSRRGELAFILLLAGIVALGALIIANGNPSRPKSGQSGFGSAQASVTATSTLPTPTFEPVDTFIPPEMYPGVPAITPSLEAISPTEAAFIVADVNDYIVAAYPDTSLEQVEFLGSEVVEARYSNAPGAYGGRLLCVVSLRGEFYPGVPPTVKPFVAERMDLIFDAHTGNLLAEAYP